MTKLKDAKPGDILRYRSRPRNKDEILCHNHVLFDGFRYFVARRGGHWRVCPCGWQPPSGWDGVHYARAAHVKWRHKVKKDPKIYERKWKKYLRRLPKVARQIFEQQRRAYQQAGRKGGQ